MTRQTFKKKPDIVSQVKTGNPILCLSRERHIRKGMISEWVRKYDLYGDDGLRKQPRMTVTSNTGCSAIWCKHDRFGEVGN